MTYFLILFLRVDFLTELFLHLKFIWLLIKDVLMIVAMHASLIHI